MFVLSHLRGSLVWKEGETITEKSPNNFYLFPRARPQDAHKETQYKKPSSGVVVVGTVQIPKPTDCRLHFQNTFTCIINNINVFPFWKDYL